MFTLTLIFSKDREHVLMCFHKKQNAYNFVGGKVEEMENEMDASYRELFEETGISRDDVDLKFVRMEQVVTSNDIDEYKGHNVWRMYVTAGILNKEVSLHKEKNELVWIDIDDINTFLNAFGNGNCYTFMLEAKDVLDLHYMKG